MSLHLASAFVVTPTESARLPVLGAVAGRLLALARRLRPGEAIRTLTRSDRLSAADLRDTGLRADQIGQAPIWGHGGIIWRP
jgi:hypothetical protein